MLLVVVDLLTLLFSRRWLTLMEKGNRLHLHYSLTLWAEGWSQQRRVHWGDWQDVKSQSPAGSLCLVPPPAAADATQALDVTLQVFILQTQSPGSMSRYQLITLLACLWFLHLKAYRVWVTLHPKTVGASKHSSTLCRLPPWWRTAAAQSVTIKQVWQERGQTSDHEIPMLDLMLQTSELISSGQ